jgi:hypothetical protein
MAANIDPRDHEREEPAWAQACQEKGVYAQWLSDLQNSFVCNFSPRLRPGAYVHGYKSVWGDSLAAFVNENVPLWIWWGNEPARQIHLSMKQYLPTKGQVEKA